MKAVVVGLLLLSSSAFADDDSPFDIMQLPQGASVTLPRPATTLVPLLQHYRVAPTDRDQVFRISAPNTVCDVKIHVYDRVSDEVKMATLKAGESMVYRFSRFNGVRVYSMAEERCKGKARNVTKLVLESNRPLEIGM